MSLLHSASNNLDHTPFPFKLSEGVFEWTGRTHFPEVHPPGQQSTQIFLSKTQEQEIRLKNIRRKKKENTIPIFFENICFAFFSSTRFWLIYKLLTTKLKLVSPLSFCLHLLISQFELCFHLINLPIQFIHQSPATYQTLLWALERPR